MSQERPSNSPPALIWFPLVAMVLVLILRVANQHHWVTGWPNLSPMMALVFAGTLVFPKPWPWWSWALILLGVDIASTGVGWWFSVQDRPQVLLQYACYVLAAWSAGRIRRRAGIFEAVGGTLVFATLFYLVTNTVSWWVDPIYAKTFAGWRQALTIGNPAFPPTLVFFRNSLIADMIGAVVLVAIYNTEAMMRRISAMPWVSSARVAA
jgi:hypothetical protein